MLNIGYMWIVVQDRLGTAVYVKHRAFYLEMCSVHVSFGVLYDHGYCDLVSSVTTRSWGCLGIIIR